MAITEVIKRTREVFWCFGEPARVIFLKHLFVWRGATEQITWGNRAKGQDKGKI